MGLNFHIQLFGGGIRDAFKSDVVGGFPLFEHVGAPTQIAQEVGFPLRETADLCGKFFRGQLADVEGVDVVSNVRFESFHNFYSFIFAEALPLCLVLSLYISAVIKKN